MATRQKKREQEQKKKREQEEKEAEAEDFLLARRVEDGQVRPWSQETQARLRIQDVEDAIKNSQDSQGQIQHQRWVVEAKEELERREAEKERMEAELEEEDNFTGLHFAPPTVPCTGVVARPSSHAPTAIGTSISRG